MKTHPKSPSSQLNLALLDRASAKLPPDQPEELALALIELLASVAALREGTRGFTGGQNEFETHE
ncbi:MAG: hypothetical protein DMG39_26770 [Acidobacteria bacterium]|nr:MAG: hypothetical protein DMG39_26770 [Acidobacteriota bacterium]